MTYYVSDMHFGSKDVAIKRHYSTCDEMSNDIIFNWNRVVCETDSIYILGGVGDFNFLKSLNGEKHLIMSDSEFEHMKKYVSSISTNRDIEYDTEMYSWYLKSEYGVHSVCYSKKMIHKNYAGRFIKLLSYTPDSQDKDFMCIIGGIGNEYQRLFRYGINSNIFMNGMYPISEVEVEELFKHVNELI